MHLALKGKLKLVAFVIGGAGVTVGFQACGPGFSALSSSSFSSESYSGGAGSITVKWMPNRESAVNSSGGGYRVLYTQNSSLTSTAATQDVPYVSGSSAPTSATLSGLVSGKYNIYVVAYSTMKSTGSPASSVATVTVK